MLLWLVYQGVLFILMDRHMYVRRMCIRLLARIIRLCIDPTTVIAITAIIITDEQGDLL